MSQLQGNFDDFAMDSVTLPGPLAAKLRAVREAGFAQLMLAAHDLVDHPAGWRAAVQELRDSGVRPTGLHLLRDYEGLAGHLHEHKVDIAKSMLELCAELGCPLLLVSASTSAHASSEHGVIARDLRKLAMLAVPLNIRIAYQANPGGRVARDFVAAWDAVCRADAPNLGLALGPEVLQPAPDAPPLDDLELIDPEMLFLVRLSDFIGADPAEAQTPLPHRVRVFPGEGMQTDAIAELVLRVDKLGYRGSYAFDVINQDYRQIPLEAVAQRARRAAVWLGEEVLHRSVPLPGAMRLKAR